jgi:2-keto-4-pentenoate hydratase
MMQMQKSASAAAIIWNNWQRLTRIDELPADCRPVDRVQGYAVQAEVVRLSGQKVVGWKVAATSLAGQKHIGVDGPLAGPLLSRRVLDSGAMVPLKGNIMKVAEAEFCFRFGASLPARQSPYDLPEVLDAVESLHPAIEVPDSRYNDFARVGAPQLIADTACSCWFVLGRATNEDWRARELTNHSVTAHKNGRPAGTGSGANVLGDPCIALTWIANELRMFGEGLSAGDIVTTGTCVAPVPVAPGDQVRADFGDFGDVTLNVGD